MRSRAALAISLLVLAAGCATTASPRPHADAGNRSSSSLEHTTDLHTNLSPLDAAKVVAEVYRSMGFQGYNGQITYAPQAEAGDYFYARASAISAQSYHMLAECQWLRDGDTAVHFRSDLPQTEHDLLVTRIHEKLAAPAPASAGSGAGM
jgi:hypothetical protein